jgi:tetratricopeptide (TPR) repeat protein
LSAVEWVESLGRPDDHAELIAHHYASALELLAASGGTADAAVRERARIAFRRAGDRAAALNAFGPAADHYAAAIALWPEDADRPRLRYGLARAEFYSGRDDGRKLSEAAESLLDVDPVEAATAFGIASEAAWHRGDPNEQDRLLGKALDLVEPLPDSEAKAWIIARAARHAMLASRRELAVDLGERALAMASALDLPEVRAHALNSVGAAQSGSLQALALLEESIALSARLNSPEECRGHHNLGVCAYIVGDVQKALAHLELAVSTAERFGIAPIWRFSRAQLPGYYFRVGRWDEAVTLADDVIAQGDSTSSESARLLRAWLQVLRGETAQAVQDTESALEVARRMGTPQGMYPALAVSAFVRSELGEADVAKALLAELADIWAPDEIGYGAPADMVIVWFDYLGTDIWRELYDTEASYPTAWLRAARALADEQFDTAIDIYAQAGATVDVASAQLYAARKLVAAGRPAEAARFLQPALSYYRAMHAARRVHQAETLLPISA